MDPTAELARSEDLKVGSCQLILFDAFNWKISYKRHYLSYYVLFMLCPTQCHPSLCHRVPGRDPLPTLPHVNPRCLIVKHHL